jgi:quinol monooxygenase YgiN
MSQTLVVVATITAKTGHEAAVEAALRQVVPHSREEAGCLRYELHSDNEQPGRFVMLEEWAGTDALVRHEAMPHFQALGVAIAGLVDIHLARLTKLV